MVSEQILAAVLRTALLADPDPVNGRVAIERVASDEPVAAGFETALRQGLGDRFPECATEPCDHAAGPRLLVRITERERDYSAEIAVTSADGRRAEVVVECAICTAEEAGRTVAARVVELMDAQSGVTAAHLEVTSNPTGATVEIDGKSVGRTPLRVELEPGPHDVVVNQPGHVQQRRHVELAGGGEDSLRVELRKDSRPRAMRIAGWSLVGIGVAGVVTGIALIATDENPVKGNCEGVHVDPFGNCEFRWNTLGAGVGLLVPGLVAAASGAALVVVGRRKGRDGSGRHARVKVGLARVTLDMRF